MVTVSLTAPQLLHQIHVGIQQRVADGDSPPVKSATATVDPSRVKDLYVSSLLRQCPPEAWPKNNYDVASARPILVSHHHQTQLAQLSDALVLAITDIVERWWSDPESRFPERMPLGEREEALLRASRPDPLPVGRRIEYRILIVKSLCSGLTRKLLV